MGVQGVICQGCGLEAPAKYVEFHQNIGALVVRFSSASKGNLCKRCVHAHFWKKTLVTLAVGWIGTISLVLAPIFVIMNIVRYVSALGMPGVPADARRPELTPQAVSNLHEHQQDIIKSLNGGQPLVEVAHAFATKASVTPGQVVLYVAALAQAARQAEPVKTYGFPVGPAATPPPLPSQPVPVLPIPTESENV